MRAHASARVSARTRPFSAPMRAPPPALVHAWLVAGHALAQVSMCTCEQRTMACQRPPRAENVHAPTPCPPKTTAHLPQATCAPGYPGTLTTHPCQAGAEHEHRPPDQLLHQRLRHALHKRRLHVFLRLGQKLGAHKEKWESDMRACKGERATCSGSLFMRCSSCTPYHPPSATHACPHQAPRQFLTRTYAVR